MYHFRPFCNFDPPNVAAIWRSQPPQRALMQPVSVPMLEQFVFSKHYFDRNGLILATRDDEPVGFVHAAFGPNDTKDAVSTYMGTTQLMLVRRGERGSQLPADLLAHSEEYLRSRGAQVLYAGGIRPLNAFYLGLYGGSELPGVLSTDPLGSLVRQHQYREVDRVLILQRTLAAFRPPISRQLRQLRREVVFQEHYAPRPQNWWEACTIGDAERVDFQLVPRGKKFPVAKVAFWDVEPLATSWGLRTAGMTELYVQPEMRRRGLATYLLAESFKQLRLRGVTLVEAQAMHLNQPALSLYGRLGFCVVDCGFVFRKDPTY